MIRGTGLLLVARIVSAVSTLAVLALIARTFAPSSLGAVSIGLTLGAVAIAAVELGSGALLVREGAHDAARLPSLLGAVVVIRVAALIATLMALGAIAVVAFPESASIVFVASASIALQQLPELARAVSISQRRYGIASLHSIAENLGWFGAIAAAMLDGWALDAALLVGLCWLLASAAVGVAVVRGQRIGLTRPDVRTLRRLLVELRPYAAFGLLNAAATRIDVLVVGLLAPGGLVAAGHYYAATRLVAAAEFLPEAAGRALLPEMSGRRGGEAQHLEKTVAILVAIALPIPVLALTGGDTVMAAIFGIEYGNLGWLLALLCLGLPFRFASSAVGVGLTSLGAQGRLAIATAAALVVSTVMNLLLVPALGVAGAAAVTVASSAVVFALYVAEVKKRIPGVRLVHASSLPLAASVVSAGVAVVLAALPALGTYAAGVAFLVVYGGLLALATARRAAGRRAD